jgi:FkbM family methyltransferase
MCIISTDEIKNILDLNNIIIHGCLHIGAHNCEELILYNNHGLNNEDIIWIDALPFKVEEAKNRGIPNVYNALITDKDDEEFTFNISNNYQSSSIFEFGTHSYEHPGVIYINKLKMSSITIDTFLQRNNLNASKYDFWNFDIQGAELLALKGSINSIIYAKVLYLEVSKRELYINGALIQEIDDFLSKYNFKRVLTTMTEHGWGDALYILNKE